MNAQEQLLTNAIHRRSSMESLLELTEDYFTGKNIEVFDALMTLAINDIDINLVTIMDNCKAKDHVVDIYCNMTSYDDRPLIDILKRDRFRRMGSFIMKDALNMMSKGLPIDEQLQQLTELYDEMHRSKHRLGGPISEEAYQPIEQLSQTEPAIKTGISYLDNFITGIYPGQLVVIAAAPGSGKSTIALQIADFINDVVFYSYEMTKKQLYIKMLSSHSGVDSFKIKSGCLDAGEFERVDAAREAIKERCNMVVGEPLQFVALLSDMKRQVRAGVKCIVIDYLQLIAGSTGENQEQKIAKMTRAFKLFALEHGVPMVVLSQLTKDITKENKAPSLGHLRGSGAIGQDADTVLFLWQNDAGYTKLLVAKAREGKTGEVESIEFEKEYSRFISRAVSFNDAKEFTEGWWHR